MIPFTESLRYDYALDAASLCVDIGGYEGNWAKQMRLKYGCRVDCWEPVKRFYDKTVSNLYGLDKIRVYNFGVAATVRDATFHIQNDSSGEFAGSSDTEVCKMLSILQAIRIANVRRIDVLKINAEGAEYEILEALLVTKDGFGPCIDRLKNIQVQFHTVVEDWQRRYDAIAGDLSQTHELTWREPFVWENWSLKQ